MIRDHHDRIVQGLRDREPVQQIATAVGCTRQGLDLYIATAGLTPLRDEARAWREQQGVQRAIERGKAAETERRARMLATAVKQRAQWQTKTAADAAKYTPFLEANERPDGKSVTVWGWIKTAWQIANGYEPARATVTHADMLAAVRAYQAQAVNRHYFCAAEWHRLNLGVSKIVANWRITFSPELQAMFPAPVGIDDTGQLVFDA